MKSDILPDVERGVKLATVMVEGRAKALCPTNKYRAGGELSAETMERCFKIPRSGVPVKHLYYEDTVYPACNETMLDCTVADKLGSYCTNNGRVVFVYCDGHTYVAKGYWIVSELEHVGYSKSGLFVPFSNGEQITDFGLASQWEALTKKK